MGVEEPPSLIGGAGLLEDKRAGPGKPRLDGGEDVAWSPQFRLGDNSTSLLVETSPLPPWSGVDTRYTESWTLTPLVAKLRIAEVEMEHFLWQISRRTYTWPTAGRGLEALLVNLASVPWATSTCSN